MDLNARIDVLDKLGKRLLFGDEYLDAVIHQTEFNNKWFSKENQQKAVKAFATNFLNKEKLQKWVEDYSISEPKSYKKIALIPQGNIPLSGFHDLVSIFISGHKTLIKLAETDRFLFPCMIKFLKEIEPKTEVFFKIANKLEGFDAVIAELDNKSMAIPFEKYFGKYPNIIRKKRNSVAVLSGNESKEDLLKLGEDIFQNFGIGSRNVSKVYLPKDYDLKHLLEVLHNFKYLVLNNKYKNNFDYNFSLYSLNRVPFNINGCVIILEAKEIKSRIGSLHYETYEDLKTVEKDLEEQKENIQNIVSSHNLLKSKTVPFGKANWPELDDYDDKKDSLNFLKSL